MYKSWQISAVSVADLFTFSKQSRNLSIQVSELAGNPYLGAGLSAIDLIVLTRLNRLLFLLIFFTKQATLMRRLIVLNLSLPLVFPA